MPAIEYANGYKEYYKDGIRFTHLSQTKMNKT
jgi:hypothetical protein